jgi:outer membrane protein assembly factor BamB
MRTLVSVFVVMMTGLATAGASDDWPIYHGDSGLRGVSTVSLSESLGVRWRCRLGAPVASPPVVCGERIFVAVEKGGLLAVDLEGKRVWSVSLRKPANPATESQESFSTPPLCLAGMVFVGTDQGVLYAFDAGSGAVRWKQKIGEDLLGSPNWMTAKDGAATNVLVMSRNDGVLKCLALGDGRLIWASESVSRCDTPPSVGPGVAVFGACDSAIHILSLATGKSIGAIMLGDRGPMAGGTAVDGHQAFIGTRDGSVVCADSSGSRIVWSSRCASNEVFTTPAVTSNRVVVGASDGRVYCLDRKTGNTMWSAKVEGTPSSPLVAGDKVVVSSEGTLFLLSLATGKPIWSNKAADSLTSPAITGAGVIVGTDDGFLILFGVRG